MLAKAWQFLGKGENTDLSEWPELHQGCVRHYAMLLSNSRPPRLDVLWISFRYCVARDLADEKEIASLYTALIHRCTFDEFCAAYESCSLFHLFEKYNLTPAPRGGLRHLPGVISLPIVMSVWYLKACILSPDSPLAAIILEYGFIHCTSQAEREALVEIYRAAFFHSQFDELRQACIQGKTFAYVKRFVHLKESDERAMSRLMKNDSSRVPVLRYVSVFLVFVLFCLCLYLFLH
ncbi:hypothetical protein CPB85DRAFT_1227981 [Mucidula mucida]|nr:hypothetical protein CPB85DRAFT_1227981 [Mucidula mucida]